MSLSGETNIGARLRALPRTRPYSIERFVSSERRRLVRGRLEAHKVGAVICDVFTSVNVPDTRVPIVLNHENVEHTILRRYYDVERNPAKRAYAWLEYLTMPRGSGGPALGLEWVWRARIWMLGPWRDCVPRHPS
jgi:hypothetical protein